MIDLVLRLVENWNFLIPLLLWFGRESYVRLKRRDQRTRVWSLRRSRDLRLVVDEQRISGNYLTGDIGPLAEARAVQKLLANFLDIGVDVNVTRSEHFDRSGVGNVLIVGTLRNEKSLAVAMLQRLGEDVQVGGEMVKLGAREFGLDLELAEQGLKVGTEYGIFTRQANPDDPRHQLIILTSLTSRGLEMVVDLLVGSKVLSTGIHDGSSGIFLVSIDPGTGRTAVEKLQ